MKSLIRSLTILALLFFNFLSFFGNENSAFFNIKNYGATGNGKTLDSKTINTAIEAASNAGGGTVYFPAGNYLCGTIHLQSKMCLFIDQGATIIAAPVSAENGYDEEEESVSV